MSCKCKILSRNYIFQNSKAFNEVRNDRNNALEKWLHDNEYTDRATSIIGFF